ncbi:hypothetical protein Syun_020897 [Stephania yunnanensis]|uniref:Uncharacterized protein n=1 Tax=Stephania yunnanensis TaxID=152371 RepID=A0AAP0NQG2_9MAGN
MATMFCILALQNNNVSSANMMQEMDGAEWLGLNPWIFPFLSLLVITNESATEHITNKKGDIGSLCLMSPNG